MDTKWTRADGSPLDEEPIDRARQERIKKAVRGHAGMLKVREIAERLGVSTAAVYGWVERGELAHARLFDNAIRVAEDDLAVFIGRHRSQRAES